jgi:hypothetical protein
MNLVDQFVKTRDRAGYTLSGLSLGGRGGSHHCFTSSSFM